VLQPSIKSQDRAVVTTVGYVGAPLRIIHQHDLPLDQRPHKLCCGCIETEIGNPRGRLEERLRKDFARAVSRMPVSIRSSRHRDPEHDFGLRLPWKSYWRPDLAAIAVLRKNSEWSWEKSLALRDLQYDAPLDYQASNVKVIASGREIGSYGRKCWPLILAEHPQPLCRAELLADPRSGVAYQVQCRFRNPNDLHSDVEHIPVTLGASYAPLAWRSLKCLRKCSREYHRLMGRGCDVNSQHVWRRSWARFAPD